MFKLLHQCNNIVETTQLTNDSDVRISLSMWMFEVSTDSFKLQHKPSVFSFDKSFTALLISPCGRLPQITWSACFRLCFSTLHPTCDSPLGLHSANLEATGLLWWNLDSWSAARFVRCALCLLARRPAGRWTRWAADDCFKNDNQVIIYKQNNLLFIKTSLWRHRQERDK